MRVWHKQTTKNGRRIKSKRFYGTLYLSSGKTKHQPLTLDRASSVKLLRKLQGIEDDCKANGTSRNYGKNRQRPIGEFIAQYEQALGTRTIGRSYFTTTMSRIRIVLAAAKIKTLADMDANKIDQVLAQWRDRDKAPIALATSNHAVKAVKGFACWMYRNKITPDHTLVGLKFLTARHDLKRRRRSLTSQELQALVQATERSKETIFGLSPESRAMLYRVAAYTGLRARELASLTKESIDLEEKTIMVQAAYSKRRRNDVLPLHPSLLGLLTQYVKPLKPNEKLWAGIWVTPHVVRAAEMLRKDLARANIPYRDSQGRYMDFHALRHTFITSLARANVHIGKAKELARHSTITLTMDVYSHFSSNELREAISTLPSF